MKTLVRFKLLPQLLLVKVARPLSFFLLLLFLALLLLSRLFELVSSGGREHKCVCVCARAVLLRRMRTEAQRRARAFHQDLSQQP